MEITRRRFLRATAGLVAASVAPGCDRAGPPEAGPPEPLGPVLETLKVRGYRGLAELPWFELGEGGALRLVLDDLPAGIDFHAHLGMSFFLAPSLDLLASGGEVRYLMDCDGRDPPCVLDLDVYVNHLADEGMLEAMRGEVRGSFLFGSESARTHTIPNLLAEMDRMGIGKAVVHAIAPGFPWGDDLSLGWIEAVAKSDATERLLVFGSVHPGDGKAAEKLRELRALGIRGIKMHPTMQRFYPDDRKAMELYALCEELGLIVFYHAGRAGIEPTFMQKYATMDHYLPPVEDFPRVRFVFGHSGARDLDAAIEVARGRRNVWMDVHGQGVSGLRRLLSEIDADRLVFGTDWPFYPVAPSLAKLLIATEGDPALRDRIFAANARDLLGV